MPRLPDLDVDRLSPAQAALHSAIAEGPRGAGIALSGPFRVWMHSPDFGLKAQRFGAEVRYGGSLPRRLFELAVLVCAHHWNAEFEWRLHAPLALAAGVPRATVEALLAGEEPTFADAADTAVFEFSRELLKSGRAPDEVFAAARDELGLPRLVELVGVLGYYSLVALTLNAFEA